jgi:hypothetical protein
MLYTIKINVECSDDLSDEIDSPELVFEEIRKISERQKKQRNI